MSSPARPPPERGGGTVNSRFLAAQVVASVLAGKSLNTTLAAALRKAPPAAQAQIQDLCYGTVRWHPRVAVILNQLLHKPLPQREREVRALALVGLYGLLYTQSPAYATVSETVAAARCLRGKGWATGLINAVLRGLLRRKDEILRAADASPAARYAHPDWLLQRLQEDWPADWEAVVTANNEHPPMVLRIALDRCSRSQYLSALARVHLPARPHPTVASAVTLERPCEVGRLPGFDQGLVSVQDAAAQLAALLLDPGPGQRVLDACAAPGGKTGHVLELQPEIAEVVAIDNDKQRLTRVEETLERLQRRATLHLADAADTPNWWNGERFERILLDVPCSATGVIRRHPDIKLLRRANDIAKLAERQLQLLQAIWNMLACGGKLVYATCSVLKMENCDVLERFLAQQPDARVDLPTTDWGRACGRGVQILPGDGNMDGFFYVRLLKQPGHWQ